MLFQQPQNTDVFTGALALALGFGLGYADDCTTVSLNYSSVYLDRSAGQPARNQTLMLSLQLRTLGETRAQTSLGEARYLDGLSYNLR